jgi:putative ABC transport system permease protein
VTWDLASRARSPAKRSRRSEHRLRAALSAIGIVVGIATVVTALAIGEGARQFALSDRCARHRNVFIGRHSRRRYAGDRPRRPAPVLSLADMHCHRRHAAPGRRRRGRIAHVRSDRGFAPRDDRARRRHPSWRHIAEPRIAGRGSRPTMGLCASGVGCGGRLARELFAGATPIGSRPCRRREGTFMYLSGAGEIGAEPTPTLLSLDTDRSLLVPLSAADASLGDGDDPERVQEISVRANGAGEVERTAAIVAALLARRHPGVARYELIVPRELLQARMRAQHTFNVVPRGIGALARSAASAS